MGLVHGLECMGLVHGFGALVWCTGLVHGPGASWAGLARLGLGWRVSAWLVRLGAHDSGLATGVEDPRLLFRALFVTGRRTSPGCCRSAGDRVRAPTTSSDVGQ